MPIKQLTFRQHDKIYDIIDGDWSDYEDVIDKLNHEFAKIYGYRNRSRTNKRGVKRSPKRKKKLTDWQKFIKANSKKKKFKFANGKLKLKTMGIAYRKTAAYKRNKKK